MVYALILIFILFTFLIREAYLTRKGRESIKIKVHISGTRGKSSITKYITTALQSSGKVCVGKVTGEIPTLILPDGKTKAVKRNGPARITEQFKIIRKASKTGVDALVLECMSIDPLLQKTESRFFNPDIYVISNIKDDHREKTGMTSAEQVQSFCQTIPENCILVSNDQKNLAALKEAAEKRNSRLVVPEKLSDEKMKSLPFNVFVKNIEIAVEVAVLAGVKRDFAQDSIFASLSVEESKLIQASESASGIAFLNAFTVNDTESANEFLNDCLGQLEHKENLGFVFNTRSDRPTRTDLFAEWIKENSANCKFVWITGDHKQRAFRKLKSIRNISEINKLRSGNIPFMLNKMKEKSAEVDLMIGIGNIKDAGYKFLHAIKKVS